MAKRTKKAQESPAKESQKSVLDCSCTFGGLSIGDGTARLGIRISRSIIGLAEADRIFVGHRLDGEIALGGSDPGQGELWDDLHERVSGTFDSKRIGVSSQVLSIGITFSLNDIPIQDLAKFSTGEGRIRVAHVESIADDIPADDEADDEGPTT